MKVEEIPTRFAGGIVAVYYKEMDLLGVVPEMADSTRKEIELVVLTGMEKGTLPFLKIADGEDAAHCAIFKKVIDNGTINPSAIMGYFETKETTSK